MKSRGLVMLVAGALAGCASFVLACSDDDKNTGASGPNSDGGDETSTAIDGSIETDTGGSTLDAGCKNYVLGFTGTQFLDIVDDDALEGSLPLTIEAWVKLADVTPPSADIFAHYQHGETNGTGWRFSTLFKQNLGPYAELRMYPGNNQPFLSATSGEPLAAQVWTHVAITVAADGQTLIYLNGSPSGLGTMSAAIDNNKAIRIGASSADGSGAFRGQIDDLRITRRVVYPSAFAVPTQALSVEADTIALWHFDEGSGTTATDLVAGRVAEFPPSSSQHPQWIEAPCAAGFRP